MSKSVVARIQYYTRKLNQYSQQRYDYMLCRSDKQPAQYRLERLKMYKRLLHEEIG